MKTLQHLNLFRHMRVASLTVETALLMPVLLFTVFSCVYLDFHLHNRAVLTARAAEMAITGKRETAAVLFGTDVPEAKCREDERKRIVSFETVSPSFTDPAYWRMKIIAEHRLPHPVRYLRVQRVLKEAAGDGES